MQKNYSSPQAQARPIPSDRFDRYSPHITLLSQRDGGPPTNNSTCVSPFHENRTSVSPLRSATSVIGAFRDLQTKTKAVEIERAVAVEERDRLRKALHEKKKMQSIVIGKQEIDSTEYLLKIRSSVDTRQRECNLLSAAVSSQAERNESTRRALTAQRLLHENLQQDVLQMEAVVHKLAQRNSTMQVELESINHRKDRLEKQSHSSPSLHSSRYMALLDTASALQEQILQTQQSKAKIDSSADALQTYVELLLKINGDLLDTLIQREKNRAGALRIDTKYKPPPRYSWPKEIPSTNIMDVISAAAAAKAAVAAENAARETSTSTVRALMQTLSPGRKLRPTDERAIYSENSTFLNMEGRRTPREKESIFRESILSAARLAAAAETAVTAAAEIRSRSASPDGRQVPIDGHLAFIPPGDDKNNEFNVIANVSKANRAAQHLHATVAAKEKSLLMDGQGILLEHLAKLNKNKSRGRNNKSSRD